MRVRASVVLVGAVALVLAAAGNGKAAADAAAAAPDSAELLDLIRTHNRLWLDPQFEDVGAMSYAFRFAGEKAVQRFKFSERPKGQYRRGVTLWTGLDQVLYESGRHTAEVRFRGTWQGRPVAVVAFLGPPLRLSQGNGIYQTWRGYSSGTVRSMRVVFDPATWRPLVALHGDEQVHFLDYHQTDSAGQAPLRIVILENGRPRYDFRFQLFDDRVWLFDRSYFEGKKVAWTDEILFDGQPAEKVIRMKEVAADPVPGPCRLAEVTDRTDLGGRWAVIEDFLHRNEPWLHPQLGHLSSVAFVHAISPGVFLERYAWRRDDASVVAVTQADENGKWGDGRWEVTTPEPALYVASTQAKLATRKEDDDPATFRRRALDHLIGTQCRVATIDFGRNPDDFTVYGVTEENANGRITIELRPVQRRYAVRCGGTLHYYYEAQSGRVRSRNVARAEIELDAETKRPLRETDYSDDDELVCEVEFADYVQVGDGLAVPQAIQVRMPFSGYALEADYRFEWRREGLWILSQAESQLTGEESHAPHTQTIQELRINQPSRALDEALANVARTQAYLEAAGTQVYRAIPAHRFVLGQPIQLGRRTARFRVNADRHLVVDFESTEAATPDEPPSHVLLAGNGGELLGIARRQDGQPLDFGASDALGDAAFFVLTSDADANGEATGTVEIPRVPFAAASEIVIDIPDQQEGKTRAKRLRFERDDDGNLVAAVDLVSTDHLRIFGVTVSVALLDAEGRLVAGAAHDTRLKVEWELKSETVRVELGNVPVDAAGLFATVGVARSRDYGAFGPSTWATYIPSITPAPFSTEQLLAADEVGTWTLALENLADELEDRVLERGILDDWFDYQRAESRGRTPKAHLATYAPRIAELLDRRDCEDAAALELLCRLAGYTGQEENAPLLKPHVRDPRDSVRDAAAIGLGLLGDDAGMTRLVEIIRRPDVRLPRNATRQQREAWKSARRLATDAALAVAGIGTERAIRELGEAAVNGVKHELDVRKTLILLLRNSRDPAAVEYLAEIVAMGDEAKGVWGEAARALALFKEAARDGFTRCLQQGSYGVVEMISSTGDDHYVPLVRELFFKDDVPEWTLYQAANYLWNTDTEESLKVMQELFDADPRPELVEPRLRLAVALAARGDDRGFGYAAGILRELAQPYEAPEDKRERRDVERKRKRQDEMAVDVFQRARGLEARVNEFLGGQLQSDDEHTVLAALRIVEELGKTPSPLLPLIQKLAQDPRSDVARRAQRLARR